MKFNIEGTTTNCVVATTDRLIVLVEKTPALLPVWPEGQRLEYVYKAYKKGKGYTRKAFADYATFPAKNLREALKKAREEALYYENNVLNWL